MCNLLDLAIMPGKLPLSMGKAKSLTIADSYFDAIGVPRPEREYRFHPTRLWRFDFAWPAAKVALEYEGGTWSGGAHTRGGHFDSDAEKYNEACLAGWGVLRFTATHLKTGAWVDWLQRALRPQEKGDGQWRGKKRSTV